MTTTMNLPTIHGALTPDGPVKNWTLGKPNLSEPEVWTSGEIYRHWKRWTYNGV